MTIFYKVLLAYCLLFLPVQVFAAYSLQCDPELRSYLKSIESIPEGKKLISTILEKGPLKICRDRNFVSEQFSACWAIDTRTIFINWNSKTSPGEIISSMLFEMQNASVSDKFEQWDEGVIKGKVSKESYVKAMEYQEYLNSIAAAKIAEKGIKNKLFPKDAGLYVYPSFEEYFYYQKISGHSAVFAQNYDILKRQAISRRMR